MKNADLQEIFVRYLSGEASPEEIQLLLRQFDKKENEAALRAAICQQLESDEEVPEEVQQAREPVLQDTYNAIKKQIDREKIEEDIEILPEIRSRKWLIYSTAAAIILLIISSFFIFSDREKKVFTQTEALQKRDIAPGGNKAILTLANGTKITLDSTTKGIISIQGNTKIVKGNNGLLTYNRQQATDNLTTGAEHGKQQTIPYNTITTPKGGRYRVVLSDGTKVWLNAASSIRFPSEFTGKMREVRVSGEAYFEVTDNAKRPFKVLVNDITVQVLGTHFNVMAYKDEPVAKITLLEGAVKVKEGNKEVLLKRGQQVQVKPEDRSMKVENVDLQGIIAWKNNQFWFNDDNIQTVMRELARWYNVKMVIKGRIPQHFDGYISRDIYVSKVLEALQATSHLQYKIQDSTIIVSP